MELTRWEKHYLRIARHNFIRVPRICKAADKLIERGLVEPFSMVICGRVEHRLTPDGRKISDTLQANDYR